MILKQLNVLELLLDCITEPNEKLVEFGVGGICNSCVGKHNNLTLFADPKKSLKHIVSITRYNYR
jgi:hypothetical protein